MPAPAKEPTKEILVIWPRRETECAECGGEIHKGGWLTMSDAGPLCLACADLDHLVFLPSGNVALTRRAKKLSRLCAVVVQWARARKRYERQGLLVEEEALACAEEACLADAELREQRRLRGAVRRDRLDSDYVTRFAARIRELYPGIPSGEATGIAEHACRKYSGRVGRSAAAKDLEEEAVTLAVRAHIRHAHTRYDELLMEGLDRRSARHEIEGEVDQVEDRWRRGVA